MQGLHNLRNSYQGVGQRPFGTTVPWREATKETSQVLNVETLSPTHRGYKHGHFMATGRRVIGSSSVCQTFPSTNTSCFSNPGDCQRLSPGIADKALVYFYFSAETSSRTPVRRTSSPEPPAKQLFQHGVASHQRRERHLQSHPQNHPQIHLRRESHLQSENHLQSPPATSAK